MSWECQPIKGRGDFDLFRRNRKRFCRALLPREGAAQGVSVYYVMRFDNVETVKGAVEIDNGVAIVPENTIRQEVSNRTLVAVRLEGGNFTRQLGLIYRKGKVLSPAMKKFIELLKEPL